MTNLATVTDDQWRARPEGVTRTIESIALHVGACKVMYDDYAFGRARCSSGRRRSSRGRRTARAPMEDVRAWLGRPSEAAGHVAASPDDAQLDVPRLTNWGERRPTRWIVAAMITHDAYHAGEINHLRSQLSGDDRWRYVQLGFG